MKFDPFKITALLIVIIIVMSLRTFAQVSSVSGGESVNTITTAVPFLLIAPDSRAGAMGDAGVATSPDANSIHWNPAKLAFVEDEFSVSYTYTPWLRSLVPDISLSYLSGYYKIDEMSTIAASLRYFSLGDIQFTDEYGTNTIQYRPNEFAVDLAYSRKLSDRFSGGLALRFVNSNLTGGQTTQGAETKPGRAIAADVYVYYQNDDIELFDKDATFAFGAGISNIGNKMTYSDLQEEDFLPINLRLGPRLTFHLDDYNDISLTFDVNKLMVPTPPIYEDNTAASNYGEIVAGEDPNRSVASGMFTSFYDAPGTPVTDENGDYIYNDDGTIQVEDGSVLREELRELSLAVGVEYWYNKLFAARAGYYTEHELKGNRKYLTFGLGLKYNFLGIDFSYLVPFYVGNQRSITNSPLQNTMRFSLYVQFEDLKNIRNRDEE
ncbi:MAG: hypothetical protein CL843_01715 [Crocinitomicaceae bacterium]|nr:hypothetical protein [Crocinitomicaceae bacterium]|tara:strand:- start:1330 stop:2637 length:1308 start_codon:yes stop_codon:yes gene_type:complete